MLGQIALLAIDDVPLELLLDRRIIVRRLGDGLGTFGKQADEMRQRIKSLPPPVVNQIQRGIPLLIVDLVPRKNFARVNDRRRQTRLASIHAETRC